VDNLTHSLCGALVAELWLQLAPERLCPRRDQPATRRLTYIASIAANNLPDADLLLTLIVEGKLGYLLHHRGHTHTVVGALGLGCVLLLSLAVAVARAGRTQDTAANQGPSRPVWLRGAFLGPACVSLVGVLMHLVLDFGNNYGVHPFWPLDNRWFYGDAVFIIEPWWWSVAGACLAAAATTRTARWGLAFVWLLGTFAVWLLPLPTAGQVYATLLGLSAGLVFGLPWTALRLNAVRRILVGSASICALYALQLGLRSRALDLLNQKLASQAMTAEGALQVFDRIATPLPGTPWCWDIIVLGTQGADYVMKIARVSALPSVFSVDVCPLTRPNPSAPLHALQNPVPGVVAQTAPHGVTWDGEYRVAGSEWYALSRDCTVQAFLRYARAPFVGPPSPTGWRVLGDLRYDRLPEAEFAEIELPAQPAPCPSLVPGWRPPRSDVEAHFGHDGPR
jgi:inner membrane protein